MEWRKVIYDDFGRATPKTGTLVKEDDKFVYLRNDNGIVEAIAKSKIMRQEIRTDAKNGVDGNGI